MNNEIFSRPELKSVRRKLRSNYNRIEVIIWRKIKAKQLGHKFRRQHSIGSYIVDFYCPELKLIIELDGMAHDSDKQFCKDLARDDYLKGLGLHIMRYTSNQILKETESVIIDIKRKIRELEGLK